MVIILKSENNVKTNVASDDNRQQTHFGYTLRRLLRIPLASFGLAITAIIILCAIFAPLIAPYSPEEQSTQYLSPPSKTHLLGTDKMGRDVLSRLVYGSQISLIVSLGAVTLGIIIGMPIGLISGYSRGWVDAVLMRAMDALLCFPSLLIAIGMVAVLGNSLTNVIVAIGLANMPFIARIVRAQALTLREQPFVLAARSIGEKGQRIIFGHIMPNCFAPVIVQGTLGISFAILTEAALSFLGIGVPPPTPTWGSMLRFAVPVMERAPLLSIVPGLAIFLLVLAVNFVGDALRDVLDPRLRGSIS